ncbi:cholinesterase-like [Glandiceps talaboti]
MKSICVFDGTVLYVASLLAICGLQVACQNSGPTVKTRYGELLGKKVDVLDSQVDTFLGIPYAEPPIGELRFKAPTPSVKRWGGVRNATTFSDGCLQQPDTFFGDEFRGSNMWNPNVNISEDCLYLNVWTPYPRPTNAAVMVWIHGGGFVSGVSSLDVYNGATLSAIEQVVVVSMNYRLGALGFLALRDQRAPGNMGLKDQTVALQWVKDNIDKFGGDPNEVTIFGESAGAASVGLHLYSPMSKNLFKRAILQSGSPLAPWAITSDQEAVMLAEKLAEQLQCEITSTNDTLIAVEPLLECFHQKTALEITDAQNYLATGNNAVAVFSPVVDQNFLKRVPAESVSSGSMKSSPILIGINRDEGTWFMPYYLSEHFSLTYPNTTRAVYDDSISKFFVGESNLAHDVTAFNYINWEDPDDPNSLNKALSDIIGDSIIACPTIDLATVYNDANNDVFMYSFNHRASNNPWPEWFGVLHGDEIDFAFGRPLHSENGFNEEDRLVSKKMMKFWANFAKTGDPNKERTDSVSNEEWPLFDSQNQEYIILKGDGDQAAETGQKLKAKHCAYWRELYPKFASLADVDYRQPTTCSSIQATLSRCLLIFTLFNVIGFFNNLR